ncbi:raffinose/stachyose/melibiose transport system permease protein [Paenibacillus algorifonticola]|uniref:Raffinose/stachyose/melibiose transport system permease protein n=1 Tax=Paenibacillus algorifonticola TaxID=684063 RepID=A0A1I2HB52_9BACL|nr:carbohydrate ABC transporter permease [Paenibacillus algorifonticola]SFF25976.1 raffinose/stachyose/melibiose transport system permease protein [Paenibacillus algorifonticola]
MQKQLASNHPVHLPEQSSKMFSPKSLKKTGLYTFMSFIGLLQLIPLVWLVLISFKNNAEIQSNSAFSLPETWQIQNYVDAWVQGEIGDYFFNSVLVTTVTVIVVLLLGSMMAYALTRMRFRWSGVLSIIILSGVMVPVHATLVPLFTLLRDLGLLKSQLAIILPYITVNIPIAIFILSSFLRGLPKELEEAAFIDGYGVIRAFFHVVLPLLRPALASVGIFIFLNVWNELLMAVTFIQKSSLRTLPLGLMNFSGEYSVEWGPLCAAMFISTIPLIIIYLFFSEQLEKSFTAGSILK